MRAARIALLLTMLSMGFVIGFSRAPKLRNLAALPVPRHTGRLSYSGPLMLPQIKNPFVLGEQAIDPVEFVNDINKERAKIGSPALTLNTTLMRAAKLRAGVMRKYQNFSHQDPFEQLELGTVLPKLNYHFVYAEENIGMGGLSAADFVNGFMHSDHHREALLDPRFTETGAAIADGPYRQYYVNYAVQIFTIPSGTDEYLGYSADQKQEYETMLKAVDANLNPFLWAVARLTGNRRYSDTYYRSLTRQKQILETIVPVMRNNKPLSNQEVSLILEYNRLLSS